MIYFWTIAKPSHRDYFELHWMQINIYGTIAELRTLTTDRKLFTTLWIVQNHTNTALIIEILALSPFKDSECVCCPLVGDYKIWPFGVLTKTVAERKNMIIWNRMKQKLTHKLDFFKKSFQNKGDVKSLRCGYALSDLFKKGQKRGKGKTRNLRSWIQLTQLVKSNESPWKVVFFLKGTFEKSPKPRCTECEPHHKHWTLKWQRWRPKTTWQVVPTTPEWKQF